MLFSDHAECTLKENDNAEFSKNQTGGSRECHRKEKLFV